MTRFACIFPVLTVFFSATAGEPMPWSVHGGSLTLSFRGNVARDLGLVVVGSPARMDEIVVELPIGDQGSLEFLAPGGHFKKLLGGSLPLATRLDISWPGGTLKNTILRIAPASGHPPKLQLIDDRGGTWFTFEYGHFVLSEQRLDVKIMDLRMGAELAIALGARGLAGQWVGSVELASEVSLPGADTMASDKGACTTPEWPTQAGVDADLAMTEMEDVSQVVRSGGRVAIAPAAYFRNVGTADLPWFAMFTTPESDSAYCFDSGDGTCEPYGNDQGGVLVYQLYRHVDGRLEQLGRSAAKHAFNSVNFTCGCSGGRIVWQGCEDNYPVGNNADRDFLGPRAEITAHTGMWQRAGSIFDPNGDGLCDHPSVPFLGSIRCIVPLSGPLDRLLHVDEADLVTPGARYFMETWYVVRDDVNIFNSMGFQEISPTFNSNVGNGTWMFPCTNGPCTTTFTQGPVVDELFPVLGGPGFTSQRLDSPEGRFQVITRTSALGGGRHRYDLMIMNFDFDRQFRELSLPLPLGAGVNSLSFADGDDDPANDWIAEAAAGELRWRAPSSAGLDWGSLYTFSFEASLPAVNGSLELVVSEPGLPSSFTVSGLNILDDVIHLDGFEGQP